MESGKLHRELEADSELQLEKLQQAYSDRSLSFHKPETLRYTILWDLGGLAASCWPFSFERGEDERCFPCHLFRRVSTAPKCPLRVAREELSDLKQQVNEQRWNCWEAENGGKEIQVSMLSGKSWQFKIGRRAKGCEVRERVAALAAMNVEELDLICGGRQIQDYEVLAEAFTQELSQPLPQLQLLRIVRPLAVTCSTDCTLKLWDLGNLSCVGTLRGHGDGVMTLAVDWTAKYAVSGSHDCTLRVWDLEHGICVQELSAKEHPPFCLAFDYTAKRVLTGSWDRQIKLWDTETAACVQNLCGHTGIVKAVRLHWPSRRALSAAHDGSVRLWDLDAGTCRSFEPSHGDEVWCADADWENGLALSGSRDRSLILWNLESCTRRAVFKKHKDSIACVALDARRGLALSGSWDYTVRIWDLQSLACVRILENASAVTSLSVVAVALQKNTGSREALKLWDLDSGECTAVLDGHLGAEAKGITADGTNVSVGYMEAVSSVVLSSPTEWAV